MPYIYKITNTVNNKVYIGKTLSSVEQRWKEHKSDAASTSKQHRPLYAAMHKYGIDKFSIEQIEEVATDELACEREIYWIEYYGSYQKGYNATKGGDGRAYIDQDKIYQLFQEGKNNKEICEILGYTDQTVTAALKAKGVTAAERQARGHEDTKQGVLMLDKITLEILQVFDSYHEAERFLNKSDGRRHISEVCNGKRKTAYGYKWKKQNYE